MGTKVSRVPTPASQDQVVAAIVKAWKRVFNENPTWGQVGKTWAQIGVETGNGTEIFNHNVGNINWTKGYNGDYYETTDSITIGDNPANRKFYTAKMRSYKDLFQGVADYLTLLKN